MSYDEKCYYLAQAFINDMSGAALGKHSHADLTHELAQVIQTAIEDFLEDKLA